MIVMKVKFGYECKSTWLLEIKINTNAFAVPKKLALYTQAPRTGVSKQWSVVPIWPATYFCK